MWNQVSDTTGIAMVEGSGVPASETRELPPFDRVELAGSNQVTIRVGGEQSVVVHADDNLLDRVTTRVSGAKLSIGNKAGGYRTRNPIRVDVVVPAVDELTLSGSGTIDAEGVDVDELTDRAVGQRHSERERPRGTHRRRRAQRVGRRAAAGPPRARRTSRP